MASASVDASICASSGECGLRLSTSVQRDNGCMKVGYIPSSPTDGQPWRLDWIGDVFYRRQHRYTQPFIRIALSRISLDPAGIWSFPTGSHGWPEQCQVSVPVSTLTALRIGTVWVNGALHADPKYVRETFQVTANRDSTTVIKAGVADDEGHFILPFEAHPYHKAHTHSYCLQALVARNVRLVIPAPELIRFYFGSSSTFLGRLFQGPFREDSFWTQAKIDDKGVAKIDLAKGISGISAPDVARIAFDPVALHAAKLISHSLMARSSPEERSYPKMVFPFNGNTLLTAMGVWLPGVAPSTFLVFQLLSCTHRLPFAKLDYTLQKRQGLRETNPVRDGSINNRSVMRKSSIPATDHRLASDAPDSRWQSSEWRIQSASRFPDLDRKQIIRADPTAAIRVIWADAGDEPITIALGDGEGKTGIRRIDLVAASDAPVPKGHPLQGSAFAIHVNEIVQKLLEEGRTVLFVPLDVRQRFPQFSIMPEMISEEGEIHPLSYLEDGGRTRPRYVSVFRVVNVWPGNDAVWVLPEIENIGTGDDTDLTMVFSIEQDTVIDACWIAGRIAHSVKAP
ncbi:hypothetical protein RHDC4_02793 [Rhodocyclaceae bacterium]|nr:hypothetical protein RHDC4_02793 [Rhodocyclaceae bacterium]